MAHKINNKSPRSPKNKNTVIYRLISTVVGALIGLQISGLFAIVVGIVVLVAVQSESGPTSQLLNTALTLVGSALGAVLGYFFGRRESS